MIHPLNQRAPASAVVHHRPDGQRKSDTRRHWSYRLPETNRI